MAIEAPFITGSDILSTPIHPELAGGFTSNFAPGQVNPLGAETQQTFTRLDTENNATIDQERQQNAQAMEQARQQAFQDDQRQKQEQHDLLTRQMAQDHEDAMQKQAAALQNQQMFMKMMVQNPTASGHTLTDNQGNPMPIENQPEDQSALEEFAKSHFVDGTKSDPNYFNSIQSAQDMGQYQRLTQNALWKSAQIKQAQLQLAQEPIPEEQQKLQAYIDKTKATPLSAQEPVAPYMPTPTVQSVIPDQYTNPKNYVSYDDGTKGTPAAPYQSILSATDQPTIEKGARAYQSFRNQPEATDPAKYQALQDDVNAIAKSKGMQPIDLGGYVSSVTGQPDHMEYNDKTYAQRKQLYLNHLAATELLHTGRNIPDEDAEKDAADLAYKQEQARKLKIENDRLKSGQAPTPKPQTPEEINAQANANAVAARVRNTIDVWAPTTNKGVPIPDAGAKANTPNINIAKALKEKGFNPTDWENVTQLSPAEVKDMSGIEDVNTDPRSGKITGTGTTKLLDNAFVLRNKSTDETRIAFLTTQKDDKGNETGHKLSAFVDSRTAAANIAKDKFGYNLTKNMSDEMNRNQAAYDENQPPVTAPAKSNPVKTTNQPPVTAPVRIVKNGVTYERDSKGKWRKLL